MDRSASNGDVNHRNGPFFKTSESPLSLLEALSLVSAFARDFRFASCNATSVVCPAADHVGLGGSVAAAWTLCMMARSL